MRGSILNILARLAGDYKRIEKLTQLTKANNVQKRNSNKSKLKQTKSKPSAKYKSSKPMKSKAVSQYRNKSNI